MTDRERNLSILRVGLVNVTYVLSPKTNIFDESIGLCYLASVLREKEFPVELFQFHTGQDKEFLAENIWGFKPDVMKHLETGFSTFLGSNIHNNKSEYYLPGRINDLVNEGLMSVKMLETDFAWFGVTYQEDKPQTIERINSLISKGDYPDDLWNS